MKGPETFLSDRVARERQFHDHLADDYPSSRAFLDRLACSFYDKQTLWQSVWRELGSLEEAVVLDYCCGTGGFSIELARRGAVVFGIDISPGLIMQARQSTSPLARSPVFLVQDAHQTAFPDKAFDFVFGNGALHHLHTMVALREVLRILKPGGRAIFIEPLAAHPLVRLVRRLTPRARSIDERPFTLLEVERFREVVSQISHKELYLLAVAAAPLNLISTAWAKSVTSALCHLDDLIFRLLPSARNYAWAALVSLSKH